MTRFGLLLLMSSVAGLCSFGSNKRVKKESDSAESNPIRTKAAHNFLAHWSMEQPSQLVLIAQHKEQTSLGLQQTLHEAGYNTIVAENGQQAFASALRYKPDLILVDADLPILNGLQTTQVMRKNPTTRAIPIIVLTHGSDTHPSPALFSAGVNATIPEPTYADTLSPTVTRLLQAA